MFAAEMKKIWTFQTFLVIIVFSILFFFSFLYQWTKPFQWEGDSLSVRLDILSEWIAQYGNTIDQAEFDKIAAQEAAEGYPVKRHPRKEGGA